LVLAWTDGSSIAEPALFTYKRHIKGAHYCRGHPASQMLSIDVVRPAFAGGYRRFSGALHGWVMRLETRERPQPGRGNRHRRPDDDGVEARDAGRHPSAPS